jgi:hypothetical protein
MDENQSVGRDTLARSWIGEVLCSFLCSFEAVCFASSLLVLLVLHKANRLAIDD